MTFKRIDVTLDEAATIAQAVRRMIPAIADRVPPMLHGASRESTVSWLNLIAAKFEEIVDGLATYRDKDGQAGTFDPKQAAIRNGTYGT
jgi:hypothetical protein